MFNSVAMNLVLFHFCTTSLIYQIMYKNFFRWVYFWLLMAAGFGLFISEEALNVWVCPLDRYHQCDHAQLSS